MILLDDFATRALVAGIGIALIAGPLGCFVVWRRMAYFGDAIAHAAILGVAGALLTELPITVGVAIAAVMAAALVAVAAGRKLAADTLLGAIAHGGLAIGVVAISLVPGVRVDLESFLFGDILAVTRGDLAVIWTGVVLILLAMVWFWRGLLLCTLSEDLALAEGHRPVVSRLVLMIMLAMLVAIGLKIVGALLITALMILPAAAARFWAASPIQMAVLAAAVGAICTIGGVQASLAFDTPTGPSIVCCAVFVFLTSVLLRQRAH